MSKKVKFTKIIISLLAATPVYLSVNAMQNENNPALISISNSNMIPIFKKQEDTEEQKNNLEKIEELQKKYEEYGIYEELKKEKNAMKEFYLIYEKYINKIKEINNYDQNNILYLDNEIKKNIQTLLSFGKKYKNAIKNNNVNEINFLKSNYIECYSQTKQRIENINPDLITAFKNLLPENIEEFDKKNKKANVDVEELDKKNKKANVDVEELDEKNKKANDDVESLLTYHKKYYEKLNELMDIKKDYLNKQSNIKTTLINIISFFENLNNKSTPKIENNEYMEKQIAKINTSLEKINDMNKKISNNLKKLLLNHKTLENTFNYFSAMIHKIKHSKVSEVNGLINQYNEYKTNILNILKEISEEIQNTLDVKNQTDPINMFDKKHIEEKYKNSKTKEKDLNDEYIKYFEVILNKMLDVSKTPNPDEEETKDSTKQDDEELKIKNLREISINYFKNFKRIFIEYIKAKINDYDYQIKNYSDFYGKIKTEIDKNKTYESILTKILEKTLLENDRKFLEIRKKENLPKLKNLYKDIEETKNIDADFFSANNLDEIWDYLINIYKEEILKIIDNENKKNENKKNEHKKNEHKKIGELSQSEKLKIIEQLYKDNKNIKEHFISLNIFDKFYSNYSETYNMILNDLSYEKNKTNSNDINNSELSKNNTELILLNNILNNSNFSGYMLNKILKYFICDQENGNSNYINSIIKPYQNRFEDFDNILKEIKEFKIYGSNKKKNEIALKANKEIESLKKTSTIYIPENEKSIDNTINHMEYTQAILNKNLEDFTNYIENYEKNTISEEDKIVLNNLYNIILNNIKTTNDNKLNFWTKHFVYLPTKLDKNKFIKYMQNISDLISKLGNKINQYKKNILPIEETILKTKNEDIFKHEQNLESYLKNISQTISDYKTAISKKNDQEATFFKSLYEESYKNAQKEIEEYKKFGIEITTNPVCKKNCEKIESLIKKINEHPTPNNLNSSNSNNNILNTNSITTKNTIEIKNLFEEEINTLSQIANEYKSSIKENNEENIDYYINLYNDCYISTKSNIENKRPDLISTFNYIIPKNIEEFDETKLNVDFKNIFENLISTTPTKYDIDKNNIDIIKNIKDVLAYNLDQFKDYEKNKASKKDFDNLIKEINVNINMAEENEKNWKQDCDNLKLLIDKANFLIYREDVESLIVELKKRIKNYRENSNIDNKKTISEPNKERIDINKNHDEKTIKEFKENLKNYLNIIKEMYDEYKILNDINDSEKFNEIKTMYSESYINAKKTIEEYNKLKQNSSNEPIYNEIDSLIKEINKYPHPNNLGQYSKNYAQSTEIKNPFKELKIKYSKELNILATIITNYNNARRVNDVKTMEECKKTYPSCFIPTQTKIKKETPDLIIPFCMTFLPFYEESIKDTTNTNYSEGDINIYNNQYLKAKETIKTKNQNFLPLFKNSTPENIEKFDKEKINIDEYNEIKEIPVNQKNDFEYKENLKNYLNIIKEMYNNYKISSVLNDFEKSNEIKTMYSESYINAKKEIEEYKKSKPASENENVHNEIDNLIKEINKYPHPDNLDSSNTTPNYIKLENLAKANELRDKFLDEIEILYFIVVKYQNANKQNDFETMKEYKKIYSEYYLYVKEKIQNFNPELIKTFKCLFEDFEKKTNSIYISLINNKEGIEKIKNNISILSKISSKYKDAIANNNTKNLELFKKIYNKLYLDTEKIILEEDKNLTTTFKDLIPKDIEMFDNEKLNDDMNLDMNDIFDFKKYFKEDTDIIFEYYKEYQNAVKNNDIKQINSLKEGYNTFYEVTRKKVEEKNKNWLQLFEALLPKKIEDSNKTNTSINKTYDEKTMKEFKEKFENDIKSFIEIVSGYKYAVMNNNTDDANFLKNAYNKFYLDAYEKINKQNKNFLPIFENLIPENIEEFDEKKINIDENINIEKTNIEQKDMLEQKDLLEYKKTFENYLNNLTCISLAYKTIFNYGIDINEIDHCKESYNKTYKAAKKSIEEYNKLKQNSSNDTHKEIDELIKEINKFPEPNNLDQYSKNYVPINVNSVYFYELHERYPYNLNILANAIKKFRDAYRNKNTKKMQEYKEIYIRNYISTNEEIEKNKPHLSETFKTLFEKFLLDLQKIHTNNNQKNISKYKEDFKNYLTMLSDTIKEYKSIIEYANPVKITYCKNHYDKTYKDAKKLIEEYNKLNQNSINEPTHKEIDKLIEEINKFPEPNNLISHIKEKSQPKFNLKNIFDLKVSLGNSSEIRAKFGNEIDILSNLATKYKEAFENGDSSIMDQCKEEYNVCYTITKQDIEKYNADWLIVFNELIPQKIEEFDKSKLIVLPKNNTISKFKFSPYNKNNKFLKEMENIENLLSKNLKDLKNNDKNFDNLNKEIKSNIKTAKENEEEWLENSKQLTTEYDKNKFEEHSNYIKKLIIELETKIKNVETKNKDWLPIFKDLTQRYAETFNKNVINIKSTESDEENKEDLNNLFEFLNKKYSKENNNSDDILEEMKSFEEALSNNLKQLSNKRTFEKNFNKSPKEMKNNIKLFAKALEFLPNNLKQIKNNKNLDKILEEIKNNIKTIRKNKERWQENSKNLKSIDDKHKFKKCSKNIEELISKLNYEIQDYRKDLLQNFENIKEIPNESIKYKNKLSKIKNILEKIKKNKKEFQEKNSYVYGNIFQKSIDENKKTNLLKYKKNFENYLDIITTASLQYDETNDPDEINKCIKIFNNNYNAAKKEIEEYEEYNKNKLDLTNDYIYIEIDKLVKKINEFKELTPKNGTNINKDSKGKNLSQYAGTFSSILDKIEQLNLKFDELYNKNKYYEIESLKKEFSTLESIKYKEIIEYTKFSTGLKENMMNKTLLADIKNSAINIKNKSIELMDKIDQYDKEKKSKQYNGKRFEEWANKEDDDLIDDYNENKSAETNRSQDEEDCEYNIGILSSDTFKEYTSFIKNKTEYNNTEYDNENVNKSNSSSKEK